MAVRVGPAIFASQAKSGCFCHRLHPRNGETIAVDAARW